MHCVAFYKISDTKPVVVCLFFGKLDKTKKKNLPKKMNKTFNLSFFWWLSQKMKKLWKT